MSAHSRLGSMAANIARVEDRGRWRRRMRHRVPCAILICCIAASLVATHSLAAAGKDGLPKTQGWIEVKTENFTLY